MLGRWTAVVAMLVLVAVPQPLLAQRRGPGPGAVSTDSLISTYASRLNLTDEQSAEIRTILEIRADEASEAVAEARSQGPDAMQALRSQLAELRERTSREVEAVLTAGQIPEYRKIQAELQEQMRNRMQGRPPPPSAP